jgi:hypothetical protein
MAASGKPTVSRVQKVQSASKNTQPRAAARPFASVISEISEIMARTKSRP